MSNRSGTVKKDEIFVTHCGSMEPSVLDFQERDIGHLAGREAKIQFVHSPDFANCHFANGSTDTFGSDTEHPGKPHTSDQHCDEERGNGMQYHANVSHPKKSGKGSSSWSKEKNGSSKSELDKGKVKISESIDHTRYEEKSGLEKTKFRRNLGLILIRNDGLDVRADVLSSRDQKQNLQLDHDERSSKKHLSDKTDQVEVSGRGKSHSLPPSGRGQNETVTHSLHLNPGRQKENGGNSLLIDASEGDDALKASKHTKRSENQNGNQPIRSRQPTINGHRVRDADATIPARRDSSCQAATNIVKEAKDLKHSADHLKNSGLSVESTGLYFQAALKFLHGASLLESGNGESAKQGEMIGSMQMYSSTAKLCEFCAHKYEKSKDIAAAALAYKCMEVAYMRVIYYSHTNASRDRHELQTALQIVPPGESPSSSASDGDNLNNPTTLDKVPITKGVSSRHIAANHVIAARNRPSLVRLLNFTCWTHYQKKGDVRMVVIHLMMEKREQMM
ncbi:AF4/FMR2 family member 2 [Camellia lanceoleosa]|uniref:AF4/FMR2 family member 2 n=1 Tax=Camellia lanceoleosa TaxID=1840588 RepID=A0ACC0F1A7_9ERIC|nr:AF4/FMR2 family member 2 [Camellia lanceoleosa]